jgi:metallo-beta-lactamase class B
MFARVAILALSLASCASVASPPDVPRPQGAVSFAEWSETCAPAGDGREAWTTPGPPFRVYGNTWYVGTCGVTALLVTTPEGHVLIDTGMADAAPMILANLERLGVATADIEALLSSHEHYDHVGATAEIKRRTGARVIALDTAVRQLESGRALDIDPQLADLFDVAGFEVDQTLQDGQQFELGSQVFTAHATPAHTPGSTSWTWQSCERDACRTMAYADSMSTPKAGDYRFADHPEYVAQVRAAFARGAAMPCDILLTPHPSASRMRERFANGTPAPSTSACRDYVGAAAANFEKLLADEAAGG